MAATLPLSYATSAEASLVVIVSRKQLLLLQVSALGRALPLQELCRMLVENQAAMVTVAVLLRA